MIKVLKEWNEIGRAYKFLLKNKIPIHHTCEKNWDLYNLFQLVEHLPRNIKIIDLGCGGSKALKLLYKMGFTNLYGVDLSISIRDRISQIIRMWKKRTLRLPFHLYKKNITQTGFPDEFFDVGICISVIEHGVDFRKFLDEAYRILKEGALLFITTDY